MSISTCKCLWIDAYTSKSTQQTNYVSKRTNDCVCRWACEIKKPVFINGTKQKEMRRNDFVVCAFKMRLRFVASPCLRLIVGVKWFFNVHITSHFCDLYMVKWLMRNLQRIGFFWLNCTILMWLCVCGCHPKMIYEMYAGKMRLGFFRFQPFPFRLSNLDWAHSSG